MSVVPEFPIVAIQEDVQIPNRTYKLDVDKGRIIGFVDDEEAINQAIVKIIYTPRFDCYAYDDQYGCEILTLLKNQDATRAYIETESESMITDAICADGRFTSIDNFEMEIEGDEARFAFDVDTTLGTVQMEGAFDNV